MDIFSESSPEVSEILSWNFPESPIGIPLEFLSYGEPICLVFLCFDEQNSCHMNYFFWKSSRCEQEAYKLDDQLPTIGDYLVVCLMLLKKDGRKGIVTYSDIYGKTKS